jgi:hypothetical protein
MLSAIYATNVEAVIYTPEQERQQQLQENRPAVLTLHAAGTYIFKIDPSTGQVVRMDLVFFAKVVPCSVAAIEH